MPVRSVAVVETRPVGSCLVLLVEWGFQRETDVERVAGSGRWASGLKKHAGHCIALERAVGIIVVHVKTAAVVHGDPGMGIALAEFPQGVLLGTQYAPLLAVALRPCLISFR
jgi:hypothetical protein